MQFKVIQGHQPLCMPIESAYGHMQLRISHW